MIDKTDLNKKYCYISELPPAQIIFLVRDVVSVTYEPDVLVYRYTVLTDDNETFQLEGNSNVDKGSFEIHTNWTIKDVKENYPEKFL